MSQRGAIGSRNGLKSRTVQVRILPLAYSPEGNDMTRHKKFLWTLMMCVVSMMVLMAIPANLFIAASIIVTELPLWLRITVSIVVLINITAIGYLFDRILDVEEPD